MTDTKTRRRKAELTSTTSVSPPGPPPSVPKDPLKADFRNFLYLVWHFLGLGDPTPIQYDIAYYLQHGPKRSIILGFRGVAKSWITVAYIAWCLYCDPEGERALVVSAGKDKAEEFTTFALRLIMDMPLLRHLKPRHDQRSSTQAFDVDGATPDQAPSVKSVGIFGQLTGSRARTIVGDDIETPKTAETETQRIKLRERQKEFDAVIKPGGKIVLLGTYQVENSIYVRLEEAGYEARIWPALYPDTKQREFYGNRLAPLIRDAVLADPSLEGTPTEPKRFPPEDLEQRRMSWGRSGFALQYMLDTRMSTANATPLKLSDLIVLEQDLTDKAPAFIAHSRSADAVIHDLQNVGLNGDRYHKPGHVSDMWETFTGSVMCIDPSGRGKDETAYAVVKHLAGYLFVVDAGGIPGGFEESVLTRLALVAKKHKVNEVVVEENFGQGMFANLLQPVLKKCGHECPVTTERHTKQKELRIIDTLEPVMSGHRLVVLRSVIEADYRSVEDYEDQHTAHLYRLFFQMSRITREKKCLAHDDRLDVLAMAVGYWEQRFKQDQAGALADIKEAQLQDQLNAFLRSTVIFPDAGGVARLPDRVSVQRR